MSEVVDLSKLKALAAHCRRCRHRVGTFIDGGKGIKGIDFGNAIVFDKVRYFCKACRGLNTFRPESSTNGDHARTD